MLKGRRRLLPVGRVAVNLELKRANRSVHLGKICLRRRIEELGACLVQRLLEFIKLLLGGLDPLLQLLHLRRVLRPLGSALTSKELRRQRAAERAKYAPQMKELKKRVETAEKKLDELQKALDEASAELFNPKPDTNFAEVNRTVRTLQFEIDRYTADWEEAATALEQLTNNG